MEKKYETPADDPMEDRVRVTGAKIGRTSDRDELLLRITFRPPGLAAGEPDHATPSLRMSKKAAAELVLLLTNGLLPEPSGSPGAASGSVH